MAAEEEAHGLAMQKKIVKIPFLVFFKDVRRVFKMDSIGREILEIALPAALALAADPVASLIDTAFIGHIGPVELAAVGVAIAVFNQAAKVTIYPLVSVTTSFVAEDATVANAIAKSLILESLEKDSDNKATETNRLSLEDALKLDNLEKCVVVGVPTSNSTLALENTENNSDHKDVLKLNNLEKGVVVAASPSDPTLALENTEKDSDHKYVLQLDNLEKGVVVAAPTSDEAKEESSVNVNSSDAHVAIHKESPSVIDNNTGFNKVKKKKRQIPSASTALVLGGILGLLQAIFLIFCAKPLLALMGVKSGSPMLSPAQKYLTLRALGSPAILLSLAMQGVFRGFKDTRTPLYATVAGDLANIILDPIFIFACRLGVSGAAIAHVLSQYLISLILLLTLMRKVDLTPPGLKDLQLSRFLKSGIFLLVRVIAVTICVTLSASLAARLGPTPMAAFQICLQVWMTSSLLADGLAVAGQAMLATAFAEKNYEKVTAIATRVLQMSFVLGLGLALFVGLGLYYGKGVFSKDINVLHIITIGVPFVAATQPLNSMAFVFDGVNFGASDFTYSGYSMVLVAIASIASLFVLSKSNGFIGIWIALSIYMALRTFAGVWRMGTATGPWRYLRGRFSETEKSNNS